jgi:bifunctional DNA-binding transcriptional regulator/antitoxin component of YhaV-PrlF toxin-antitoxin module
MNALKKLEEEFEIKVDARDSIRLPQKLREKFGIQSGTVLILHLGNDGKLYFEKKDESVVAKQKAAKKARFLEHFENLDLSNKEDVSTEEFLKDSRRY